MHQVTVHSLLSGKWYVEIEIGDHDANAMAGVYDIERNKYTAWYHSNLLCCVGHAGGSYPPWGDSDAFKSGKTMGILLNLDDGTLEFRSDGRRYGTVNAKQPKMQYKGGKWVIFVADGSSAQNRLEMTIRDHPKYAVPPGYRYWGVRSM